MMTNEKLMALDFVELTDEELENVTGGIWAEFLGGFSVLSQNYDPYVGTFITPNNIQPYRYNPYGTGGTPNDYNF
ncbi:MAG: class IIb bacteriocin, lactobin A/cerein 7B family [Streptococcaceae bacterium]|jgi:bacteriocin-like protein|nr:class IIb bacteriocin, lactobin A/cerein 7B family [Streptococcaceae bacterium]